MSRLALGLVLALAFLTGCGGDDDDDGGSSASTTEQFSAPPHTTEVDDVTCRELKGFQRRVEVAGELAGEYITLEPETTLVPSFTAVLNSACEGASPGTKPVPGIVKAADVARRRVLAGDTPSFSLALFEETSGTDDAAGKDDAGEEADAGEEGDAGEEAGTEPVGDGCEASDERVKPAAFGAAFKEELGLKKLESDKSSSYVSFNALFDDKTQDEFGAFTVYVVLNETGLEILTQEDGKPIEPDAEEILWSQAAGSDGWNAKKVCGANVVTSWSTTAKRTDETWDRLTSAVGNAIDSAGS